MLKSLELVLSSEEQRKQETIQILLRAIITSSIINSGSICGVIITVFTGTHIPMAVMPLGIPKIPWKNTFGISIIKRSMT